jgi:hypothetical protein
MKIKTLIKLLIAFSFTATISIGIILACAGGDEYYYGYSNFAPEPHADTTYSPLFFSEYEMFYGIGYVGGYIEKFNDDIAKDWKTYLAGNMTEENISYLLFNSESEKIVEDLYAFITKKDKTGSYNEWNTKINLNNNEVKSFIEFLYLAKKIQKSSVKEFDYWDSEKKDESIKVESAVINQLKSKFQSENNSFLKDRYWFQTMKAYFYSDLREEGKAFFESTKNSVPKNTLYYRALSYIAGIDHSSGDYAQSNYLYSIIFDKCLPMRTTAAYCFHPQNESDWNATLALAKNADEKATLWALLGYYADEGRAIQEIYKLNPKSPHLNYLLTRLVNKTEQDIANIEVNTPDKYKSDREGKVNKSTIAIVTSIAQAGNTAQPYLWNMVTGYLQTFNGNYSQARTFFDNAEKQLPAGQGYKDQLRLLRLINKISELSSINSVAENKLLDDLKWLYIELPKTASNDFRYQQALSWSKLFIASLYKSANNIVFEQLFNQKNDFYLSDANLEAMKTLLEKQNKTPFEKLATDIYPIKIGDLYEYQSVKATFENKIELAYEYMQKAKGPNEIELKGNPFNGFIKDCHDCEHAMAQKTKFSKVRFVEVLKIMEEKVKKGEDLFNNYLLLGNAFYNITFYGNARVFYEGAIIGNDITTAYQMSDSFKGNLFDMENAKQYYVLALKAAKNDEQKAKCHYMLAKCERNEYYNKNDMNIDYWDNGKYSAFLVWTGFKKLKEQYSATKYYQDVIKECGYFATYIGKKN